MLSTEADPVWWKMRERKPNTSPVNWGEKASIISKLKLNAILSLNCNTVKHRIFVNYTFSLKAAVCHKGKTGNECINEVMVNI